MRVPCVTVAVWLLHSVPEYRSTRSPAASGRSGIYCPAKCWGFAVWPDMHPHYMIDIALATEFALAADGERR